MTDRPLPPPGSTPPLPSPPPAAPAVGQLPPPPPTSAVPPVRASDSTGLRRAAVVLFWVELATTILFAVALISRKGTWSDFEDGSLDDPLRAIDDADSFVGSTALLSVVVALAVTIVVSIWALRVARRAQHAGAAVSPGLACGGWYIPLANTVVPFVQLRRVATHVGRPTRFVNLWQGLAVVTLVLSVVLRAINGDNSSDDFGDVSSLLSQQVVVGVAIALATAVMAVVAGRAMREVDAT